MKKKKNKKKKANFLLDYIKAVKKGNREAELGSGFKSVDKVVKSKKQYTRKAKHKANDDSI